MHAQKLICTRILVKQIQQLIQSTLQFHPLSLLLYGPPFRALYTLHKDDLLPIWAILEEK